VEWSPRELLIIPLDPQETPREDVVLWSRTGEPFEILPEVDAPEFVTVSIVEPEEGVDGTIRAVRVSTVGIPAARRAGTILLRVRTADASELVIPIPVDVQPIAVEADDSPEVTAIR
jgi:hypothetical protein